MDTNSSRCIGRGGATVAVPHHQLGDWDRENGKYTKGKRAAKPGNQMQHAKLKKNTAKDIKNLQKNNEKRTNLDWTSYHTN